MVNSISILPGKKDLPPKNRVVGSEVFSYDCTRTTWSQPVEPHREITLTITIIVSGRHSFWTMDPWRGWNGHPTSLHKYLYASADPISFIDPSGHFTQVELSIALTVIGVLANLVLAAVIHAEMPVGDVLFAGDCLLVTTDYDIWPGWGEFSVKVYIARRHGKMWVGRGNTAHEKDLYCKWPPGAPYPPDDDIREIIFFGNSLSASILGTDRDLREIKGYRTDFTVVDDGDTADPPQDFWY